MPEDDEFDRERTPVSDPEIDDTPTVACSRCDREWSLSYELDELGIGNQAIEQFALDHKRHTGHYPDGVGTWLADCRHCPEEVERLSESAARRWAKTHARHTRHSIAVGYATEDDEEVVRPDALG